MLLLLLCWVQKKCNDAPWWLFVVNTSSMCMIIIACTLRTYHCNVGFGGPLSTRPLYTPWGSPVGNANTNEDFLSRRSQTFQMINNNEECGKLNPSHAFLSSRWHQHCFVTMNVARKGSSHLLNVHVKRQHVKKACYFTHCTSEITLQLDLFRLRNLPSKNTGHCWKKKFTAKIYC